MSLRKQFLQKLETTGFVFNPSLCNLNKFKKVFDKQEILKYLPFIFERVIKQDDIYKIKYIIEKCDIDREDIQDEFSAMIGDRFCVEFLLEYKYPMKILRYAIKSNFMEVERIPNMDVEEYYVSILKCADSHTQDNVTRQRNYGRDFSIRMCCFFKLMFEYIILGKGWLNSAWLGQDHRLVYDHCVQRQCGVSHASIETHVEDEMPGFITEFPLDDYEGFHCNIK